MSETIRPIVFVRLLLRLLAMPFGANAKVSIA